MKKKFQRTVTISTEDLAIILCALDNAVIFHSQAVEDDFIKECGSVCDRFKDSPRNLEIIHRLDSVFRKAVSW